MNKKVVNWVILIAGLVVAIRLVSKIFRLVNMGGRVIQEEKKLTETQNLNRQLKDQLAEVQTPQYMERQAREKLGYGKPGEIVLVIPDQDQITNHKPQTTKSDAPNWVKWRKLYLGI